MVRPDTLKDWWNPAKNQYQVAQFTCHHTQLQQNIRKGYPQSNTHPLFIINNQTYIMTYFNNSKKWAVYQQGDYTFLQRNKYHEKLVSFDVRYVNERSKVEIQESFHENNQGKVSSSGQVKFEFPLVKDDRYVYSRLTSRGKFGVYYDNGLLEFKNGQKLNLYSGFQTNRSFNDNVYKVGASVIGEKWLYAFRLRYAAHRNSLLVHAKGNHQGEWENNKWRFNFYTVVDPRISKIIKNGLLFGLFSKNEQKDTFFLRVESGKKEYKGLHWCQLFKEAKFNWTRQLSDNAKIGAQTKLNFGNWQHILSNAAIGGEWKFPQSKVTLRAKLNAKMVHTLSITHDLPNYGNYTFGLEWSDIGKTNVFKFGTAISINL